MNAGLKCTFLFKTIRNVETLYDLMNQSRSNTTDEKVIYMNK